MNCSGIRQKFLKSQLRESKRQHYLGSVLKRARLNKGLTQAETAYGVSSNSYYSKVENNRITPPSFFIEEVSQRLDVDLAILCDDDASNRLLDEMLMGYYSFNTRRLESLLEDTESMKHETLHYIAKLVYYLHTDALRDIRKTLEALEPIFNTMCPYTSKLFMLFAGIAHTKLHLHKDALILLKPIKKAQGVSEVFHALVHYHMFIAKQMIGLKTKSIENYMMAETLFNTMHASHWRMALTLWRSYFVMLESPTDALQLLSPIMEATLPDALVSQYRYIKSHSYYLADHIEDAKAMAFDPSSAPKNVWDYKALLVTYQLLETRDSEDAKQIKTYFDHPQAKAIAPLEWVEMERLTIDDEEQLRCFLRDIAMPLASEKHNVHALEQYTDMMKQLFSKKSRYKESMYLDLRHKRMINQMHKI